MHTVIILDGTERMHFKPVFKGLFNFGRIIFVQSHSLELEFKITEKLYGIIKELSGTTKKVITG